MSKMADEKELIWTIAKPLSSKVTKTMCDAACDYLGPSMFREDAATVAYSSKDELKRVRENFVKQKLNVKDSDEDIDAAIQKVGEKYGMSNRNKKRAVVYALLMGHYGIKSL